MFDDSIAHLKERIVAAASAEYPGCRVTFEDTTDAFVYFRITATDDEAIPAGSAAYLATAIADWPEEKFRYLFCQVCGK